MICNICINKDDCIIALKNKGKTSSDKRYNRTIAVCTRFKTDLKPCPFCGKVENIDFYWVPGSGCGMGETASHTGIRCSCMHDLERDDWLKYEEGEETKLLKESWNKRAEQ